MCFPVSLPLAQFLKIIFGNSMPGKQLVLNMFFIIENYFLILHFSNFRWERQGRGNLQKEKHNNFSHLFSLDFHVFHQIKKPYYFLSPLLPILSPLLLRPKISRLALGPNTLVSAPKQPKIVNTFSTGFCFSAAALQQTIIIIVDGNNRGLDNALKNNFAFVTHSI